MYFSLKAMLSNAAYFSKTFFTSPILRWILPPAFSAVPRSRKSESPAASPVFSFTFPFVSSIRPLILSLVLDFTREESVVMRILDVDLGFAKEVNFTFKLLVGSKARNGELLVERCVPYGEFQIADIPRPQWWTGSAAFRFVKSLDHTSDVTGQRFNESHRLFWLGNLFLSRPHLLGLPHWLY